MQLLVQSAHINVCLEGKKSLFSDQIHSLCLFSFFPLCPEFLSALMQ